MYHQFTFVIMIFTLLALACTKPPSMESSQKQTRTTSSQASLPSAPKSVKGLMQKIPGGPMEEVEVAVHEVPVGILAIEAQEASLNDQDLVIGVVIDGQAMAYPIRYLSLYEIVDDRVGDSPIAPTW